STLGCGPLHCVDLAGLLALAAQRVLFDELVTWAAVKAELQAAIVLRKVQGVLWHADGKGQVAAHTSDNDGGTDVTGLYFYLPTYTRAAALYDGKAAALAATASPILKGQRQIFCGGLVHLLICTAVVGLEDHTITPLVFPEFGLKQHGFITASNLLASSLSCAGTASAYSLTDCDLYSS
uniref:Uncharacterized protein n=1 Tax=Dicentrarchus labrax TaxID=13489 RepID=A0A8C4F8E0_DICLA